MSFNLNLLEAVNAANVKRENKISLQFTDCEIQRDNKGIIVKCNVQNLKPYCQTISDQYFIVSEMSTGTNEDTDQGKSIGTVINPVTKAETKISLYKIGDSKAEWLPQFSYISDKHTQLRIWSWKTLQPLQMCTLLLRFNDIPNFQQLQFLLQYREQRQIIATYEK